MKAVAAVAEILDKAYRQSSVNKKQHPPFRIRNEILALEHSNGKAPGQRAQRLQH